MAHDIIEVKKLYANIGKLITSTLDLNDILQQIMSEVDSFFSPHHWSLLRLDPNSEDLFFIIVQGVELEKLREIRLKPGEGIAGYVAQNRQSLCVCNVQEDPRFSRKVDDLTGFQTGSVLAVPIIYLDTLYGVIEIVKPVEDKDCYTEDDKLVLESIADFAAIAFANSTAFSILVDLSEMDTLTGFFNQNKLEKTMAALEDQVHHQRSHDKKDQVLVVFLDLDDFKSVNDTYGHSAGDRVLREFARRLRSVVRNNDMIFRIGGDEFLFFITVEDTEKGNIVTERLNNAFQSLQPFPVSGNIEVNFSWGISQGSCAQVRELVHHADMDMYKFKNKNKE